MIIGAVHPNKGFARAGDAGQQPQERAAFISGNRMELDDQFVRNTHLSRRTAKATAFDMLGRDFTAARAQPPRAVGFPGDTAGGRAPSPALVQDHRSTLQPPRQERPRLLRHRRQRFLRYAASGATAVTATVAINH
jgi:hypothetical protein